MTAITGAEIGKEVCKALGLDAKKVKTVTLFISPNEVVITTTEQYVSEEEAKKITEILKVYELHEKKEKQTLIPSSVRIGFCRFKDDHGIISDKGIREALKHSKDWGHTPPFKVAISPKRIVDPDWIIHIPKQFTEIIYVVREEGIDEDEFLIMGR